MKAIGYIKMLDPQKGFGFITTSTFEGEKRRSVDVYFRLNRWQGGTVLPEFAMPVVFTRDRVDDRETAKNIKPLLCKESHIKLALQQSAQKGRIALYDPNIRKPVLKDVAQEIFERMDNGARDIVRDSVLAVILEARNEERVGLVESWTKNAFVRSSLMNIFSGSCEGCDQGALALVRRVLGIKLVNNIRRSLFPEQREFMAFLSLDKYNHRELIVELKGGKVEEMRRPDFSKIKRYKYGARGSVLQRKDGEMPIQCNWEKLTGYAGDGYYTFEWQFTNRNSSDICEIEVVPGSDLVKITAKEIVSYLYNSNMNMEAGAAEKLSSLHDTLDKQLQEAGDDVFVYELLQNANDYPNGNENVDAEFRILRYKEGGGCLNFCHTGAVFLARNVAAICSANDQDKSDNLRAIGYKGIGFKTVFRFNDRAEVRSGEFGFAFDRKTQEIKDGVPWRTTPCWVYPKVRDGYRVDIRLVPHDSEKLGEGSQSYCHQLKKLFEDEKPLLFIPHLRCVRLYLDDWDRPIIRTAKSEDWCRSTQYVENVTPTFREMINDALKDTEHCRIPPKYGNLEKTAVSFACRRQGRRLLLEDKANLYCYLPAKDAQWGFKFLMNTDMIPNGPRNDIEYSLEVNKYFAKVAGGKFFEWIDSLIGSGQYEYDSIFAMIPDFEECIKNRKKEVVEFIREFQAGFESKLSDLRIPSETGDLVSIQEIVYDVTGVVERLGASFWKRLNQKGLIVHESLRDSDDFKSFIERYKTDLGISEFGFAELFHACKSLLGSQESSELQTWMINPSTNNQFIDFLFKSKKLVEFSSIPIFLDNSGKLECAASLYKYSDDLKYVEKCLPEFVDRVRFLSPKVNYHDRDVGTGQPQTLEGIKFKAFEPKAFLFEVVLACEAGPVYEETRKKLKDFEISKRFWSYVAHYRISNGKQRFEGAYSWLSKLPFVDENGVSFDSFESAEYSVCVKDEMSDKGLVDARWMGHKRIRIINPRYFVGEGGIKVKEFFCDGKAFKDYKKLAYCYSVRDWYFPFAYKFKDEIRSRLEESESDLGFYEFLSRFYDCCEKDDESRIGRLAGYSRWVKKLFADFPAQGDTGFIKRPIVGACFLYDKELALWERNGWVKVGRHLCLNEKYDQHRKLFKFLGYQVYDDNNFGYWFEKVLGPCLNLDTREKVIAFHRFMATKKSLLNAKQVAELKKAPILVEGNGNPVVGFDGVYLPAKIDIGSEIAAGTISTEIKVLDDELCDDSTIEYWKWLGVRPLDEVEIRKKRFEKYLERQKAFVENGANDAAFKEYHVGFINAVASGDVLQTLKDNGCGDLIKKVRLFSKSGKLLSPTEMKWSNEYEPLCDFESFDKNGVYVSEMYCGIEGIKELFEELGVKDKFSKSDVALLANKEFCKYFWKKYLPLNESEWNEIKDYLKADLSCVMDRAGMVRKPEELYHLDIEAYVLKLPNCESKLPMVDGIGKDRLSQIEMKTALSVEDSLAFLLADSDCEMYKMRGKVLEWIAKGSVTASHDLVDKYRSDERAKWRNGQKDPVSVKELCAIRRKNSGQVRLFASDPHVMDLTGLGIGGDGADAMRAEVENALVWLGVQLVDDGSIEIEPANKLEISDQVISDIALRMLVFLAERYPDGWGTEFTEMYARLKILKFLKCSGLVVRCKDNEWLRAEHGTFLCKDDRFYFVDDWQSKFVYGDMVSRLWEKVCKKQYSLDDLKMALDTGDGDYQFSKRIALDKKSLLSDGQFVQKLQEQFPKVHSMVYDRLRELERAPTPSTDSENYGQGVVEGIKSFGEEKEQGEAPLYEPETKKNYSDDEQEQMCRVFGNDLTPEQMNDINRIDCIRLFNNLMSKGLKPKYLLGGNDQMEKEYGDSDEACERDFVQDMFGKKQSKRKVDHSATIETNDGRIIHVVGAINGVAHLPPRWWTRLANQIDRGSAKYVVCAVVYHRDDGFQYLETKGDLMDAIGDRFTVVRVQSESREERFIKTVALFNSDPECSDYSTYSLLLLHKMKSDRSYECVFTKEFGNETINEW